MDFDFIELDINAIKRFLLGNSDAVYEIALLKFCFPDCYDSIFASNLAMYKYHFNLFHFLYRLQMMLDIDGEYYLRISPINIRLIQKSKEDCAYFFDDKSRFCDNIRCAGSSYCAEHSNYEINLEYLSVREFYLDKNNYYTVNEELIEQMLKGFWTKFENKTELPEYYRCLGLEENASKSAIKTRFRELSKLYHPDKNNGIDGDFKKINRAYRILMMCQ